MQTPACFVTGSFGGDEPCVAVELWIRQDPAAQGPSGNQLHARQTTSFCHRYLILISVIT